MLFHYCIHMRTEGGFNTPIKIKIWRNCLPHSRFTLPCKNSVRDTYCRYFLITRTFCLTDLASFPFYQGVASVRQPWLNPFLMLLTNLNRGIAIFRSGLNFQLIFKIVKCFFSWGLQAADKPCILHLIHSRS